MIPATSGLSLRAGRRRVSRLCAIRLAPLALWATPLTKTVRRTVFAALTQRATLVGLITWHKKNGKPHGLPIFWVQGPDLIPATSGLSLRAGRRRVSRLCAIRLAPLALWATPLTKTVRRTVFAALTQRATLVGLITWHKKNGKPHGLPIFWVQGPDLNQRPPGYEPDELPDCSTLRYINFR